MIEKSENKFLGNLISCMDNEHICSIATIEKTTDWLPLDIQHMICTTNSHGYTESIDLNTVRLTPQGISAFTPWWKPVLATLAKWLVLTIKNVIVFISGLILGIATGFGTNYLTHLLIK